MKRRGLNCTQLHPGIAPDLVVRKCRRVNGMLFDKTDCRECRKVISQRQAATRRESAMKGIEAPSSQEFYGVLPVSWPAPEFALKSHF